MGVDRVVEADDHPLARLLEAGDLGWREGEMDELHRGGLALGGSAVLIGLRQTADLLAADLDEGRLLDAAEAGQEIGAAQGIVDLEQHRRHQFAPAGHEGVIGRKLAGQLLGAALLDMQHLLDLHAHGLEALEMQSRDRAHLHAPHALQRDDGLAHLLAAGGIVGGGQDVGGGNFAGHAQAP